MEEYSLYREWLTSALCRLCGKETENLIGIFGDEGLKIKLPEKINHFLPILVCKEDLLPLSACTKCVSKLNAIQNFADSCHEVNVELIKQRNSTCVKLDPLLIHPATESLEAYIGNDFGKDFTENVESEVVEFFDNEIVNLDNEDCFGSEESVNSQLTIKNDMRVPFPKNLEKGTLKQNDPLLIHPATESLEAYIGNDFGKDLTENVESEVVEFVDNEIVNLDNEDCFASEESVNSQLTMKNNMTVPFPKNQKKGTPKQNMKKFFRVFLYKVKDPTNLPQDGQVPRALQFVTAAESQRQELETDLNTGLSSNKTQLLLADTSEVQERLSPESVQNHGDNDGKTFVCVHCKKELVGNDSLISHHHAVHPTKVFYCRKCNVICQSKVNFKTHLSKHNNSYGNIMVPNGNLKVKSIDENVVSQVVNINVDQSSSALRLKVPSEFKEMDTSVKTTIVEKIKQMVGINNKKQKCHPKTRWQCKRCDYIATDNEDFCHHKSTHLPLTFSCQYCDKVFRSKVILQHHEQSHTGNRPFICEYCGKGFLYLNTLKGHLVSHGNVENSHKCTECDKAFSNKNSLNIHLKSHSDDYPYLCDICGKKMKHISNFRVHRKLHLDPDYRKRYMCEKCGKQHLTRGRLMEHQRLHTKERPLSCETCDKKFRTHGQLSQHIQIHINARRHSCDICGKRFNRRGNMLSHMKRHKEHSCGVCNSSFANFGELQTHLTLHTAEEIEAVKQTSNTKTDNGSNMCQVCHKVLGSKPSLMYHLRIHSGEKPFHCEFCGKSFSVKNSLSIHQMVHSGQKPFACRFCQKGCLSKSTLVVHERHHTGEKPFKCAECKMAFRSKMNLNQHLVVHSNERPFPCPHCEKGFRRRDALDIHSRTHTGERPYGCKQCGKRFKQKGDCSKHERAHSKPTKVTVAAFQCFACDMTFNIQQDCHKHMMEAHVDDLFVEPQPDVLVDCPEEIEGVQTEEIEAVGAITIETPDLSVCNSEAILHTDILGGEITGNECIITTSDLFTI